MKSKKRIVQDDPRWSLIDALDLTTKRYHKGISNATREYVKALALFPSLAARMDETQLEEATGILGDEIRRFERRAKNGPITFIKSFKKAACKKGRLTAIVFALDTLLRHNCLPENFTQSYLYMALLHCDRQMFLEDESVPRWAALYFASITAAFDEGKGVVFFKKLVELEAKMPTNGSVLERAVQGLLRSSNNDQNIKFLLAIAENNSVPLSLRTVVYENIAKAIPIFPENGTRQHCEDMVQVLRKLQSDTGAECLGIARN